MNTFRAATILLALAILAAGAADALETDQYSTWGKPLDDATAALNAKMNYEILRALEVASAESPHGPPSCSRITHAFRRRVDFAILQPIEAWVTHSPLVPRLPPTPAGELAYRRANIYGDFGPLDIGRWVPDSPTVAVDGIRFGTDKISHFISNGWRYRAKYVRAKSRGLSDEQAEAAAIRWGIFEERTGTGLLVDGVFSRGDLEANLAGMRFYLCLCDGPDPLLTLAGNEWTMRRRFDWRDYVTPAWDESWNVSIYAPFRWRKVRPRLVEYCEQLDDPWVARQAARYRSLQRRSPNDAAVEELVRAGVLSDPAQFTLAANCPPGRRAEAPPSQTPDSPDPPQAIADEDALIAEIAAREADGESRAYLLAGATLTNYAGPSVSLGWLLTSVETGFDCRTICDLRGPTIQVEAGPDAGQVSLGYARVFGETRAHERFMPKTYLALGVRAVALRTWNDGDLGSSGLGFVGLQGQFTVTSVSFRAGALWNVGGGTPRRDQAWTWSIGWGY